MAEQPMALSFVQPITLSLSKLSLLQRMVSNDDNNGKRKLEDETESSTARKRLRLSDNNGSDDNSSDSSEETEEEVCSEESYCLADAYPYQPLALELHESFSEANDSVDNFFMYCYSNNVKLLPPKGSLDTAVKLLPCDHDVMGLNPGSSLL
jgi:hypothetical protein